MNALGLATEIGVIVTSLLVGGLFLGRFIDTYFHTAPFGLVGGMLFGIILASIILIIKLRSLMK